MKPKLWFIYILECSDGSLYTGITTDVIARARKHQEGKGAKYTRGRRPVELICTNLCKNRSDALKLEAKIKKMSHKQKIDFCLRQEVFGA